MKNFLILLPLFILFITGCTEEGTLLVKNNSQEEVWYEIDYGTTHYLNTNESDEYNWELSPDESKFIQVDYGGGYWFFYDYWQEVEIKPGKTKTIRIIGDAGEIEIWNDSAYYYIYYVYLSPSSDEYWGEDKLGADIISPGESVVWKVSVGDWDVRVTDDFGDEFTSYENYIAPEERTTFYYNGFMRSEDPDSEKLTNSQKNYRITKNLVEKREDNDFSAE